MPLPRERIYTIDDIYALPDGERAELIDGQLYMMSTPSRIHQKLVSEFTQIIGQYIKSHRGSCEVYPAPFAVFIKEDDKSYVEPDVSVICDKNKLDDRGCKGAPDWIIEIVSPSSKRLDYLVKLLKYQAAGVREYWIVDPMKNRTIAYNFEHNSIDEYSFEDTVPTAIYKDLSIDFKNLDL